MRIGRVWRVLLGVALVLALALVVIRITGDRDAQVKIERIPDGPATASPDRPIIGRPNRVVVADSTGRIDTVPDERADRVDAVIRIDPAPDDTSAAPIVLAIERVEARGLFPAFRSRRDGISIRTLGGEDSRVVVTHQPVPLIGLDPGIMPSTAIIGRDYGFGVTATHLRIGPVWTTTSAHYARAKNRVLFSAGVSTVLIEDVSIGIEITAQARPVARIGLTL